MDDDDDVDMSNQPITEALASLEFPTSFTTPTPFQWIDIKTIGCRELYNMVWTMNEPPLVEARIMRAYLLMQQDHQARLNMMSLLFEKARHDEKFLMIDRRLCIKPDGEPFIVPKPVRNYKGLKDADIERAIRETTFQDDLEAYKASVDVQDACMATTETILDHNDDTYRTLTVHLPGVGDIPIKYARYLSRPLTCEPNEQTRTLYFVTQIRKGKHTIDFEKLSVTEICLAFMEFNLMEQGVVAVPAEPRSRASGHSMIYFHGMDNDTKTWYVGAFDKTIAQIDARAWRNAQSTPQGRMIGPVAFTKTTAHPSTAEQDIVKFLATDYTFGQPHLWTPEQGFKRPKRTEEEEMILRVVRRNFDKTVPDNELECDLPGCHKTVNLKTCNGCKVVLYCCRDHQIAHYLPVHKAECEKLAHARRQVRSVRVSKKGQTALKFTSRGQYNAMPELV